MLYKNTQGVCKGHKGVVNLHNQMGGVVLGYVNDCNTDAEAGAVFSQILSMETAVLTDAVPVECFIEQGSKAVPQVIWYTESVILKVKGTSLPKTSNTNHKFTCQQEPTQI